MVDLAALFLRLGIGIMFTAHGLQKAFGLFGGVGLKGFTGYLTKLGFPFPVAFGYIAAYTELIGGICLIIGLGTRISSAFLFILITVAIITVHLKNGFFAANGGFEYPFVIAFACAALILLGTGKWGMNPQS